jgi:hypothetical protein
MTTTHPATAHAPHHLPAGAHIADRRGLTATGAVAVALASGVGGGLVDVLTGPGLRTVFAVCFVAGCGLAALKVHREDLLAAVVIPPLAYVALFVGADVGSRTTLGGSFVKQQVLELMAALVTKAPAMLVATGLAAVIALARRLHRPAAG